MKYKVEISDRNQKLIFRKKLIKTPVEFIINEEELNVIDLILKMNNIKNYIINEYKPEIKEINKVEKTENKKDTKEEVKIETKEDTKPSRKNRRKSLEKYY